LKGREKRVGREAGHEIRAERKENSMKRTLGQGKRGVEAKEEKRKEEFTAGRKVKTLCHRKGREMKECVRRF